MASREQLERALRDRPLARSSDLQAVLGVSQPTVSRLIREAGGRIVRVGKGRSTRYAVLEEVLGAGLEQPVHRVDENGVVGEVARLRRLSDGRHLVDTQQPTPWLVGDAGNGLFPSLPYFLEDLRPSGFVGRRIARRLSDEWGVPSDPRHWNDDALGRFLLRRGDDLPGDLVLGDAAANRVASRPDPDAVSHGDYPALALGALSDEAPGSSAAGEQPKFAIHSETGPVIVKFSPAAGSSEARRWQDLLRAELHAAGSMRAHGVPATEADILELGDRLFLEARRFDRVGSRGRRGAISLLLVDAEFGGFGQGWIRAAEALHDLGLLSSEDLEHVRWAETFGRWIGNGDMHLGNVSLCPTPTGFALQPLYDMLPMSFAPLRGEIRSVDIRAPVRSADSVHVWESAGSAARDYWARLSEDRAISESFRGVAERQASTIDEALNR